MTEQQFATYFLHTLMVVVWLGIFYLFVVDPIAAKLRARRRRKAYERQLGAPRPIVFGFDGGPDCFITTCGPISQADADTIKARFEAMQRHPSAVGRRSTDARIDELTDTIGRGVHNA